MIYNVDCFEYMKTIKDESIPLIVTDAPYGISFDATFHMDNADWDKMSKQEYKSFLDKFLAECKRILTPEGSMWMFYGITNIEEVLAACNESGLYKHLENATVYARAKGRGSSKKMKSLREEIMHLTKHPTKYTWNMVEYLRKVVVPYVVDGKPRGWALDISTGDRVRWTGLGNCAFFTPPTYHSVGEKQIHSCQKPILLMSALVMLSSNIGDTVLDPFAGSGATGVAAYLCDREFIGCELDKKMCEKANAWLKDAKDPMSRCNQQLNTYIKKRISSAEKGFKFGFENRVIMPK